MELRASTTLLVARESPPQVPPQIIKKLSLGRSNNQGHRMQVVRKRRDAVDLEIKGANLIRRMKEKELKPSWSFGVGQPQF